MSEEEWPDQVQVWGSLSSDEDRLNEILRESAHCEYHDGELVTVWTDIPALREATAIARRLKGSETDERH